MDLQEALAKYSPLLKHYWLPLLLVFFGLICLGYGLITFNKPTRDTTDILTDAATDQSVAVKTVKKTESSHQITIDIEGAVLKPGVYRLPSDSRVQDALIASGGLSEKADRQGISKNINLASKLADGAKLYLPFVGEHTLSDAGQTVLGTQSGVVDINQASASELDNLPGIGAATAQKIVAGRPYQSVDELLQKKIVGKKVFDQIKDKITAN